MRRLVAASLVPVAAAVLAAAAPASAATVKVKVGDNYFSPDTLTVPQHSVVKWKFVGRRVHNVTVDSGPELFSSPSKSSGKFRKHLTRKGKYKIVCSIHEGAQRMTLKVT